MLVVGPSGAGKDSIIRHARDRLRDNPAFHFPRRVVTRIADAEAEDHDSLGDAEFEALAKAEGFAFEWQAHGLKYGVPRSVLDRLKMGAVVAVNVSRTIIAEVAARFPQAAVVEITAAAQIRAARIAARGRETLEDALARSRREVPLPAVAIPSYQIVNDRSLADAGEAFCDLLHQLKR